MRIVWAVLIAAIPFCVLSAGGQEPDYVEGEVLVKFRTEMGRARARDAVSARGLIVKRHYHGLSARRAKTYCLVRSDHKDTAQLVTELRADPDVEVVEPNYLRRCLSAETLTTDTRYEELWAHNNTGQVVNGSTGTADADIDFPEAWAFSRCTGPEVVIAVIDTGVDYTHPDLASNMWTNPGEIPDNSLDDDGNGYVDDYYGFDFAGDQGAAPDSDPMDVANPTGHGTHVAGIAAASRNSEGVVGVNPEAKIMALKASANGDTLPSSFTIEAIEYAVMMKTGGVNVVAINASYGGPALSTIERDAIIEAGNAGIVFCAAAGNDGTDNDAAPVYPASHTAFNIISVAASDQNDALAGFSNFGATRVDMSAPGVDILSTIPIQSATDASVVTSGTTYNARGLLFAGLTTGITATLYDCGLGYASNFPAQVSGNIALIQRGTIFFSVKIQNAMDAGAVAAVIYNHTNGSFLGTLQAPGTWIPAVSVTQSEGLAIKAAGNVSVTVIHAAAPENAYAFYEGTSMAAPFVSGAVALAARNFPGESVSERITRIVANVDVRAGLMGKVASAGRLNLARIVDTDGDALPDWWELKYAPNLLAMHGSSDTDADSFSDLNEYGAGTDATNGASRLHLQISPDAPPGSTVLRWSSVAGKLYRVWRAEGADGVYTLIFGPAAATPPMNTHTDTVIAASAFYRVQVE